MSSIHAPTPLVGPSVSTRTWASCIALTTLLVGVSDFIQSYLLFALVRHRPAIGVLQGPAAGLLGRAAMTGGARTAIIGTLLHFLIALAWTVAFAFLFNRSATVRARTRSVSGLLLSSVLVGFVVWLTMDWAVLRFSKAHYYPLAEPYFWWLLVGHVPFVGLPLAWGVARLSPDSGPTALSAL